MIYKIVLNFFNSVKNTFPDKWSAEDVIFKKTIGFLALMKVCDKLLIMGENEKTFNQEFFNQKLSQCSNINLENIQLSSKGVGELFERFNHHF